MSKPTIMCPTWKTGIKLTESLAVPLIESTRCDYEKRLTEKDEETDKREAEICEREEAVEKAKEQLDEQVVEKVSQERSRIAVDEARGAD